MIHVQLCVQSQKHISYTFGLNVEKVVLVRFVQFSFTLSFFLSYILQLFVRWKVYLYCGNRQTDGRALFGLADTLKTMLVKQLVLITATEQLKKIHILMEDRNDRLAIASWFAPIRNCIACFNDYFIWFPILRSRAHLFVVHLCNCVQFIFCHFIFFFFGFEFGFESFFFHCMTLVCNLKPMLNFSILMHVIKKTISSEISKVNEYQFVFVDVEWHEWIFLCKRLIKMQWAHLLRYESWKVIKESIVMFFFFSIVILNCNWMKWTAWSELNKYLNCLCVCVKVLFGYCLVFCIKCM